MTENVDLPIYWDNKYEHGHIPWDLGRPTPVFQRLAKTDGFRAGKMIVLGAGRGYDARLLSHPMKSLTNFASGASS
ncbi:MAG: hypothetical protein R3293_07780 [Candidatus Promineifilaceae bacterium]|nr:hypothetical protein [Candidatus Promineifilaceae bacterium]